MDDREGVKKAFREVDQNNDGRLSKEECREIFQDLFPGCWSADDLDELFEAADLDANGFLDYCEFVDWIYGVEEDDAEPQKSSNLKFNDETEVLDAASAATDGPKRNVRARINTGFEHNDNGTSAPPQKGPKFNAEIEELDAASAAADGPKRSVRGRILTGFAKGDDAPTSPTIKKAPKFDDNAEELDAASGAVEGPKRSIRQRVNTGFERDEGAKSQKKAAKFDDNAEELDAASTAVEGPKRSVRQRVNTGFARETDASSGKKAPQFDDTAEELDAASSAAEGPKSSVRQRVNTGFERKKPEPNGDSSDKRGLQFNDAAEELDAASEATDGPKKSVRNRVLTGIVREDDVPKDGDRRRPLQFNDDAEELDAASSATDGEKKSIRTRINTGVAKKENSKSRGLKFDEAAEELDAASEATDGQAKAVRSRVNTGFAREDDAPKPDRKPLMFNDEAEELDAASSATDGTGRSVRSRVNTGFARDADQPKEDSPKKPLKFDDKAEELEAASEASGSGKTIRGRVNTGFAREADDAANEQRKVPNRKVKEDENNVRRNQSTSSVRLNEDIDVGEAASSGARGPVRKCRSRINTGFILRADSDDDELPDLKTRLSQKRASRRSSGGMSFRSSIHSQLGLANQQLHMDAESHEIEMSPDSPEKIIDSFEVTDFDRDDKMLHSSLKKLHLFEELDDDTIQDLVEEMCVYKFADTQPVIRQGDVGGTHFFVVANGTFEILKDGNVIAAILPGTSFGESVLLSDGVRRATVRAKGEAIAYGMLAADVRDMMQMRYEEKYKEVMAAVIKVLDSGSCEQLMNLNAFQRHELYTVPHIRSLDEGEVLIAEGLTVITDVYVLVQGSLVMTGSDGEDLKNGRIPRYAMVGMQAMLFGTQGYTLKADSAVKLLVISRKTLDELFTPERVPTVLLRSLVDSVLAKAKEIQGLHEEQRDLLAQGFTLQKVVQGQQADISDARLLMCLRGNIEVSTDGFASDVTNCRVDDLRVCSQDVEFFGLASVFQKAPPKSYQVRAVDADKPGFIAVWPNSVVEEIIEESEKGSRIRILKHVFLFRTLSKCQLFALADGMAMQRYAADDFIFKQGDMGDFFAIIATGRVFIEKDGRYIRALAADDYFGERALLTHEPRSASIKASQDCEIWTISSKKFTDAMPAAALEYLKGRVQLQDAEYKFEDLVYVRTIGTGGFGTVKMVQTAQTKLRYALKCIKKRPLVEYNQQQSVLNEKDVLLSMDHPFIIRLVQTFRNKAYVYFLMELVTGGELLDAFSSLGGVLNKIQTQFYTGSIILALEHLHARSIAYLDLKSENVLLDHQGYIKLVDFGLAEKVDSGLYGAKGTPHFMAPEMLIGKAPYDTTADLWALGVCCYEFLCGELPFGSDCTIKSEIFNLILKGEVVYPPAFQEKPWASEGMSFISGLLQQQANRRLGGGLDGYKAIFQHVFFKGFSWEDLLARRLKPPFVTKGERYSDGNDKKDSLSGQVLAKVEANACKEELKSGWVDPDPDWDEDFCPGEDL